jgi:ABC-type phosphate/phosphonate transport system substrate-binding protein
MKSVITTAFINFIETPEGKDAFKKIYGVDAIKKATDADYDQVRGILKALGRNADDLMNKK